MLGLGCAVALGCLTAAAQVPQTDGNNGTLQPSLRVEQQHVDLGVVREGGVYDFSYTLRNEGEAFLEIRNVRASCGCTVTTLERDILPPGESMNLNASFDSKGTFGNQTKIITVYSNDPETPRLRLTFGAVVEALYRVLPVAQITFRNKRRGEAISRSIDLVPGKPGVALELLAVHLDKDGLNHTTEAVEIDGRQGVRLSFSLDDDTPLGAYTDELTVDMRIGDEPATARIPIRGLVVSDIRVQPHMILTIAPVLPGQELDRTIMLRAMDRNTEFHIRHVDAGPHLNWDIEETTAGQQYNLHFSVSASAPAGPLGQDIVVLTDSAEQPVVSFPAYMLIGRAVEIRPEIAYLKRTNGSASATQLVTLRAPGDEPLIIEDVSCDNTYFTVAIVPQEQTGRAAVTVSLAQEAVAGTHKGLVTVRVNLQETPVIQFRVFGEVLEQSLTGSP